MNWPLLGICWTSLVFFAQTAGWAWPTLALLAVAAAATLAGGVVSIPRRELLLGSVTVAVLALYFTPAPAPRTTFFGPGSEQMAYGGGLGAMLVLVTLMLRRTPAEEKNLPMGVALVLMMVAGNTMPTWPYGFGVGLTAIFLTAYLARLLPGKSDWRRLLGPVFTLLLSLGIAVCLAMAMKVSEVGFNQLMVLANLMGDPFSASAAFGPQSRLSGMRQMQGNRSVALRVFTDQNEPHWVGRRYTIYQDQIWSGPNARKPALWGEFKAQRTDRVELDPTGVESLFGPIDARRYDIGGGALEQDGLGIAYVVPGEGFSGRYRVERGTVALREDPQELQQNLALDANTPPIIGKLARDIVGDRSGAQQRAEAIERYLQENFKYGFGYPFDPKQDPVGEFLEKRPQAHCELFASAMVLMLRSLGVPARYVTGFVVHERMSLGGYWVARVRDAHAWVEVWLPGQGWTTYDPTPPGAMPGEDHGSLGQWLDLAIRWWTLAKGWLTGAVSSVMGWGWLGKGLLGLGLIGALLSPLLKKTWRKPRVPKEVVDPALARMRLLMAGLEKRLGARGPGVTLSEWAAGLGASEREFVELYALIRYRDDKPSPEQLEQLQAVLARLP